MDLLKEIDNVDDEIIDAVLRAVVNRYNELRPDLDISVISLQRMDDPIAQIDKVIDFLEDLKKSVSWYK